MAILTSWALNLGIALEPPFKYSLATNKQTLFITSSSLKNWDQPNLQGSRYQSKYIEWVKVKGVRISKGCWERDEHSLKNPL